MAIEFAPLVEKYGYAATFAGTLLEGETVLVLSGAAAYRGYLELSLLFVIGAGSAFLTDNFFFGLGRWFGPKLLARWPRFAPTAARAHALIDRFPNSAVIGVRFFYGMRSVGPAIIGSGSMSWLRFMLLDLIAVLLWSICWNTVGYVLGAAVVALLGELGNAGRLVLAGAAAIAIAALVIRHRQHKARDSAAGGQRIDARKS